VTPFAVSVATSPVGTGEAGSGENAASDCAIASMKSAQAQLSIARRAAEDAHVRAPFSGVIAKKIVNPGEKVQIDSPMFTIVDLARMEIEAPAPASEVPSVKPGQAATFRVDGFGDRVFTGKVERINPTADPGSSSITLYISVVNRDYALRAGMFAKCQVVVDRTKPATVIPASAVRDASNGQQFVARVRQEAGLELRIIDGAGEARLSWLSALAHFDVGLGRTVVMDIGGGSLELALAADGVLDDLVSLPFGALRLTERFLRDGSGARALDKLRREVRAELKEVLPRRDWRGAQLIGSGGTFTNLAGIHLARRGMLVARDPADGHDGAQQAALGDHAAGRHDPGQQLARDAEQLQQSAPSEARVADETSDS